jgi:hypothetical protein
MTDEADYFFIIFLICVWNNTPIHREHPVGPYSILSTWDLVGARHVIPNPYTPNP